MRRLELQVNVSAATIKLTIDFNISNLSAAYSLASNRPAPTPPMSPINPGSFDVSKNIVLVPPFRESEVDTHFV